MGWNRLEGRPRTDDFDETLRAEVRDPLWMLTRQHQLGEFRGNDAGSPVFAKVKVATTRIDRYQVKEAKSQPYDESIPLETRVERRPLPMSLSFRLQIGQYWCRLLDKAKDEGRLSRDYKADFLKTFPISLPDPKKIVISGIDKQAVGQVAAEVRSFRPPEPYKGKGVRYAGEYVRRKVGKAFAATGA